jgi:hypothetical protein
LISPSLEYALAGAVGTFLLARVFRRKEHLIWFIESYSVLFASYFAAMWTAAQFRRPAVETLLWGFVAALIVDRFIPGRSRLVSNADRRKVIEKWERKTGQKFDPTIHELDHVIPFAKGGDSAGYNLRVTTRKENRSKGKRSPRWDLIGRWRD